MEVLESFGKLPQKLKQKLVYHPQTEFWELLLHPPRFPITPGKKTVYFTMWEATRLPVSGVDYLNRAECVVVPCAWNAKIFRECGVKAPIKVVPLGINTSIFNYYPMDMEGPCVFGTAGRLDGGGCRKRINDIFGLFQKAFPTENDVRLHVKVFPDCQVQVISDSRMEINRSFLSENEMAEWFQRITCFVSLSRAEAWGLLPHQALATGRPVISTKFGGMTEYFNEAVGYCVEYCMPLQMVSMRVAANGRSQMRNTLFT